MTESQCPDGAEFEFIRLTPELESDVSRFFADLASDTGSRHFYPHPFSAAEAHRLCGYGGPDLYFALRRHGVMVAYGMLRGWEEGYAIPSLGMAVHPSVRGQGLGSVMMARLHDAASAAGATTVRATVAAENLAVRRLCAEFGYQFGEANNTRLTGMLTLPAS